MIWPTLRNQVLIVCKAFLSGGCVATNISVGGNYDDSHIDWSICQSLDHIWAMQLIWACCILRRHCKLAPVGNKVLQCSQCTTRRNDLASHPALRSEGEIEVSGLYPTDGDGASGGNKTRSCESRTWRMTWFPAPKKLPRQTRNFLTSLRGFKLVQE